MTNPKIEEIKKRLESATPGPWEACLQDSESSFEKWYDIWAGSSVAHVSEGARPDDCLRTFKADAMLIANAPTDIACLLSELDTLRAALKDAKDALESLAGYESMNQYPDHEVRHALCVAVPHECIEAIKKIEGVLK